MYTAGGCRVNQRRGTDSVGSLGPGQSATIGAIRELVQRVPEAAMLMGLLGPVVGPAVDLARRAIRR